MSEPIYYKEISQNTDEWYNIRLGIVTASDAHKLFTAAGKIADNETVRTYALEKAAQRINKRPESTFQSYDMERGNMQEVIARDLYSANYAHVDECGFITRDFGGVVIGCSPDGLVSENGGIEIKSRQGKFQIRTIMENKVPSEYMIQIQTFLLVSGREWCDFVQYSNGMPLFVKRVAPDYEMHDAIIHATRIFEERLCALTAAYESNSVNMLKTEYVELEISDDDFLTEEQGELDNE